MNTINAVLHNNGTTMDIEISNVNSDDADYIKENNIHVSLESLSTGVIAVYFDYGAFEDDGETPKEHIEFSNPDDNTRSCNDVFSNAVKHIKEIKKNG